MQLTPENTADFLQRFYSFQDGCIRRFEFTYESAAYPEYAHVGAYARVTVTAQPNPQLEIQEEVRADWVNIVLDFEEVTEFAWAEGGEVQQQVIFWDLHIRHWNEQVFVDFGGLENSLADSLVSAEEGLEAFRQSKVYIAARSVIWTKKPSEEVLPR